VEATEEQVRALEREMGLDKPAWVRYLDWLGGAVTGDLGKSFVSDQQVTTLLGERLVVTFELVILAMVGSLALAIPVALLAAYRPNRLFDRLSMVVSVSGLSVANYVLALILVLIFAVQLGWFPAIGYVPFTEDPVENLRTMALPAAAIAFPLFCFYTRFLRGHLVDQLLGQEYIVTAQAEGVGPWRVLIRHAFRNSSFGLITVVGLNLSTL